MKLRLLVLSCVMAVAAFAADATGKWTAEMQGRNGDTFATTFNLKAEGNALTGTVSGRMGDTDISNGKIDGDNISFDVVREFNGNSVTIHYKGAVSNDSIQMKIEGPRGRAREVTAKRAQ